MKIAISLPDPLFEAAEALAGRLGISRSALFQRAMERMLRDYDDERTTALLNQVYASERSKRDPALVRLQTTVLAREEW